MNQITKVAAVDPVAAFVAEASRRMMALGYDKGFVTIHCQAWGEETPVWRFRPTIYTGKQNLPDITAPTLTECLAQSRVWLANLKSEKETLAAVLGIAAE